MRYVIPLIFFFSSLFCIDPSTPEEIANLSAQPSGIVGGYINVITGDFVYHKSDLTIPGAIPLTLDRFFSSREKVNHDQKWEIFNHHRATKVDDTLYIQEESGIAIPYAKVGKGLYRPEEGFFKRGATFHSLHNPKLNRVEYVGDRLTVYQSDGTIRIFRKYWKYETRYGRKINEFVLERELHRNGYIKEYEWKIKKNIFPDPDISWSHERNLSLARVSIISPDGKTTYSSVNYTYSRKSIIAEGSNGKAVTYEISTDDHSNMGYIDHVTSSDHPRATHKWKDKKLRKYILPDERKIRLSYEKQKVSTLELPEGLTYTFEYYAKWTNVTHPDRSKTTYYHSKHRLDKIVYYGHEMSAVRTEVFEWTDEGKLARKEILDCNDTSLLTIEYGYDENGNLIWQETTGAICTETPSTLATEYEYDALHRLIQETQSTGHAIQYQYLKETHLPIERLETKDGVVLKRITYIYDENHLLVSEVIDDCGNSPVSFTKNIVRFNAGAQVGKPGWIDYLTNGELQSKDHLIYNKYGDIETHEIYDAEGKYSHKTTAIYDEKGLLKKHIDPMGHTSRYKYNHSQELTKEKRANGLCIKRTYDKLGRLEQEESIGESETQKTRYKYHKTLKPSWIIDYVGDQIHNEYDGLGNLIKITLPNGGTTSFTYNALGHVKSKTDPLGYTTKIRTNIFGKPLETIHPDGTKEICTYTLEQHLATHIDQNSTKTHFTYDPYGNVIEEALFDSHGSPICKREKVHNAFQLLRETDTEGYTTTCEYNNRNQLIQKNRANRSITFTYTPLGKLKTETSDDITNRYDYDVLGNTIVEEEYTQGELLTRVKTLYNSSGNPTTITRYPNNIPATSYIHYDAFDRPIQKIDALGNESTFQYSERTTISYFPGDIQTIETQNPMGKPIKYQKFAASGELLDEKHYKYDKALNLVQEKTGNHTLEYTYDKMGRKETQLESNQRKTTYTYTPTGELATLQKPDGILLTYTYDPLGNLSSLKSSKEDIDYTYVHNTFGQLLSSCDNTCKKQTVRKLDPDGNILEESQHSGHKLSYTYNANGQQTSMTLPNGEKITYTYKGTYTDSITTRGRTHTFRYDLAGNPIEETTITSSTIHRTYDLLNRPEALTSAHLSQACTYTTRGNISSILQDGLKKTYNYDGQDRLISEPDHAYRYDMLHNRTLHNEEAYTHNTLNELSNYVYDANGNLIDDGETTYRYDSLDRLVQMGKQTFTYDAQHRRTDLLWDHDREIGTLDQIRVLDPTHPAEYAIAILIPSKTLLPVHDLQHNLIKVFTLQNEPVELHILTAFGELTKPSTIPWSFCSKRATGKLLYFGRRYYNPADGRFITPDPAGYTELPNLYAYALNNPLIYFDPKGLNTNFISSPHILQDPSLTPSQFYNFDEACNRSYASFVEDTFYYRPEPPRISCQHDLGLEDIPDRIVISVNGICNRWEDSRSHLEMLSEMYGGHNVHGIYNASHGLAIDGVQAILSLAGIYTNPEKELYDKLVTYFSYASPDATALLKPHSMGCIVVRNVLELFRDSELKDRIFVIAIAPAAYIDPSTCGYVIHYVHPNDLVTMIDLYGRFLFKDTIRTVGKFNPFSLKTHHAFQDSVYEDVLQENLSLYYQTGKILK